jgi:hypothetical protein
LAQNHSILAINYEEIEQTRKGICPNSSNLKEENWKNQHFFCPIEYFKGRKTEPFSRNRKRINVFNTAKASKSGLFTDGS